MGDRGNELVLDFTADAVGYLQEGRKGEAIVSLTDALTASQRTPNPQLNHLVNRVRAAARGQQ